jgi:ribulose bisphosphate carboxylase small subunit
MGVKVDQDKKKIIKSGYVITIEEAWTEDRKEGFWIAKDTGGLVVHAPTAEEAVERIRNKFWSKALTSSPT